MKQDQSSYVLLISIIMLLVCSAGVLNYQKHLIAESTVTAPAKNPLDELTLEKAYQSLQHLIASRSVGTIVQMLQRISFEKIQQLAHMILSSKSTALTREDKALIILGMVNNLQADIKKQYQLLDLLRQFREIKKDKPLLISAVHSEYIHTIPVMLAWMKDKQLDEVSIENAFTYAIRHNDVPGFTKLVTHGVTLTSAQATKLLAQVVTQRKMVEFVPLLGDLGANITAAKQGQTLLMQAVLQNNINMVEALLKAGANTTVNTIVDPKVGSALQLAIEKSFTDIDLLLRQYGARE